MSKEKIAAIINAAKAESEAYEIFKKEVFGESKFFETEDGERFTGLYMISCADLTEAMQRPEYQPVAKAEQELENAIDRLTDSELTEVIGLMFFGRDRVYKIQNGYRNYKQALADAKNISSNRAGAIDYLASKSSKLAEFLECGMKHTLYKF